jgi:hypothetical protein
MKRSQLIPVLFWISFSLFVMICSYQLGLEDKTGLEGVHNPGPGLMPFLAASLLLCVSVYLLIGSLHKKKPGNGTSDPARQEGRETGYKKIVLVLVSLFGYAFFLEKLGYLITTCLTLVLLFGMMGSKWRNAVIGSVVTVFLTYIVFTRLGLLFPEGIFRLQGLLR